MNTPKTKARKPRRMWQDLDGSFHDTKCGPSRRVLVIPTDPESVAALRAKVRHAIHWCWDGEMYFKTALEASTDGAMAAFGIPQRKKGRKL